MDVLPRIPKVSFEKKKINQLIIQCMKFPPSLIRVTGTGSGCWLSDEGCHLHVIKARMEAGQVPKLGRSQTLLFPRFIVCEANKSLKYAKAFTTAGLGEEAAERFRSSSTLCLEVRTRKGVLATICY